MEEKRKYGFAVCGIILIKVKVLKFDRPTIFCYNILMKKEDIEVKKLSDLFA